MPRKPKTPLTATNRATHPINLRTGITLDANASVELTPEEAAVLAGHPLLEFSIAQEGDNE